MVFGHCRGISLATLAVLLLIVGCGQPTAADASKKRLAMMSGGSLKDATAVSGKVTVDGETKAGVNIYLHTADGSGEALKVARTKDDGTYCWSTNAFCDGLEAGSYKLAFRFIPIERSNDRSIDKDDLFKGRYKDPKKSEHSLTVEAGKPQKDVNYELKTK